MSNAKYAAPQTPWGTIAFITLGTVCLIALFIVNVFTPYTN